MNRTSIASELTETIEKLNAEVKQSHHHPDVRSLPVRQGSLKLSVYQALQSAYVARIFFVNLAKRSHECTLKNK